MHRGDAGQGRLQRRHQRRDEDEVGLELGQQLAVGLHPQADIHYIRRQCRLPDPGAIGLHIPHGQRRHTEGQQGFGYGPVHGGDTRNRTVGSRGCGLCLGLRRQRQQQADEAGDNFK
ncbi:hypothetical protein D3C76_1301720 [compost metagenome]